MPIRAACAPRCPDALYAGTLDPSSAAIPSLPSIHAGTVAADAPESIVPTEWILATPAARGMQSCVLALTLIAGSMAGLRPSTALGRHCHRQMAKGAPRDGGIAGSSYQ